MRRDEVRTGRCYICKVNINLLNRAIGLAANAEIIAQNTTFFTLICIFHCK